MRKILVILLCGLLLAAAEAWAQFSPGAGGSTVTANQGTAGAGAWPVSVASLPLPTGAATAANQTAVIGTAGTPASAVVSIQGVASGTAVPVTGTFWQATQPVSGTVTANQGGTWTVQPGNIANTTAWLTATSDPCSGAKSFKPFSNGAASANLLLVTGQASKNVYVCAINVGPVASAVDVALVEGTTTTNACDTSTAGLMGGATAATGWQFTGNGGLAYGNGTGALAKTATAADNVCLLFSAGVQVSGVLSYVIQ